MFYKPGVDITNDKQMFNFLKGHFTYWTANSWNRLMSIANNVKLHTLGLSGDWSVAYALLESGEYETINYMLEDWAGEHPGYEVFFNGRGSGYLVLVETATPGSVLPDSIDDFDTYEDYKEYCRETFGSVKANRECLVYYTKLVQDFDRLCDSLRDFCDELSNQCLEHEIMERAVAQFNEDYYSDLEYLEFSDLYVDSDNTVDVAELCSVQALVEAFCRICHAHMTVGYGLVFVEPTRVKIKEK